MGITLEDILSQTSIVMYHYSALPRDVLLTNNLQGTKSGYNDNNAKYDYNDSISLFFVPIPENMASLLENRFERWVKGSILYEHKVLVSNDDYHHFRISSSPETLQHMLDNYDSETMSGNKRKMEKFFESEDKVIKANNLAGDDISYLIDAQKRYFPDDGMLQYIPTMLEHGRTEQYASCIPHVMLYVKDPLATVFSKRIKLK